MKKSIIILTITLFVSLVAASGYALEDMVPFSSSIFKSASITASSKGTVTFSVETKKTCKRISVKSCSLERLEQGKWVFVTTLSVPSAKANVFRYTVSKDYASSLTAGNTYRFKATFSADGENILKLSTSIEF